MTVCIRSFYVDANKALLFNRGKRRYLRPLTSLSMLLLCSLFATNYLTIFRQGIMEETIYLTDVIIEITRSIRMFYHSPQTDSRAEFISKPQREIRETTKQHDFQLTRFRNDSSHLQASEPVMYFLTNKLKIT